MNRYLIGSIIVAVFLVTIGLAILISRETCPSCPPCSSNGQQCPKQDCSKCPMNEPENQAISCSNGVCGANTSEGVVLNKNQDEYVPCGDDGLYVINGGTCSLIEGAGFIPFMPPTYARGKLSPLEEIRLGRTYSVKNRLGWTLTFKFPTDTYLYILFSSEKMPEQYFIAYQGTGEPRTISHLTTATFYGIDSQGTPQSIVTSDFLPLYNGESITIGSSINPANYQSGQGTIIILETTLSASDVKKKFIEIAYESGGPIISTASPPNVNYRNYSLQVDSSLV